MSSLKIFLNGEPRSINEKTSITNLILQLELDLKKIAIERNLEVVLPEDFDKIVLVDGDRIEIVHFIGGG